MRVARLAGIGRGCKLRKTQSSSRTERARRVYVGARCHARTTGGVLYCIAVGAPHATQAKYAEVAGGVSAA